MDTKGMIDVSQDPEEVYGAISSDSKDKGPIYPTLHLEGLEEDPELPDGEFYFMAKGKVKRVVEETDADDEGEGDGAKDYSCDIEVMEIKPMDSGSGKKAGSDGLDAALTKIAQDKQA